ncbi:BMP family ABC transporter substrate-binding protein [Mycobacterium sp. CBMA247]|nr:BMP family ABC transporter substrate-binding protein [Mycolicibacterium sp. CBMA 329]MUL86449.1 BMP family ABC transporter substrate-binding protein [Mycolicibacterium sp. CBMA 331]MUM29047.1 BMP family ABC transporter substrate-binding protein [Mycolicibacterium sp. CBMA 295]MUM36745.1 BMP family ABC transporter substrate-binding protein [Mycolicibacterium sp. CBMA 247]MUM42513.1 BMP family ABC transporter substrate-binding protein [Mycolicibacterium sp. CBMA 294]
MFGPVDTEWVLVRFRTALRLVLVVALVTVVAACGISGSNSNSKGGGPKIGFVYVSPLPGSAWSRSWDETRKDLEQEFDAQTTVVQPIPENPDVISTLQDLIRKGNKLIFTTAFGYQPFVLQVAKDNPDVNFVVIGPWAQEEERPANVSSVAGNLWEARYLTGIVAGSMTKSKVLGFVSAFGIPAVVSGIDAFQLGAQSVDPAIRTKVVFTSNWYNPPQSTQAAETLARNGADVIAQHEDSIGPLLGAQSAGIHGIGSESDTSDQAPKAYLTGTVWDWTKYASRKVQETLDGNYKNDEFDGGLADGLVTLGRFSDAVPQDVIDKVEQARKDLVAGKLVIFKGPLMSNTGKEILAPGEELRDPAEIKARIIDLIEGTIGKVQ